MFAFAPSVKRRAPVNGIARRAASDDAASLLSEAQGVWNVLQSNPSPQAAADAREALQGIYQRVMALEDQMAGVINALEEEFEQRIAAERQSYAAVQEASFAIGELFVGASDAATYGNY